MKNKIYWILGFVVLAQLFVPISMILNHERILRIGTLHQFKTRPIDPADPFQGRYVVLGFENSYIPGSNDEEPSPNYGEKVFVQIETDSEGFCQLKSWSRTRPDSGPFLKLAYNGRETEWNRKTKKSHYRGLRFALPFSRFYMNEKKAPRAEKLARRRSINLTDAPDTNGTIHCWANVRVLNGAARLEDVMIDGISLRKLASDPAE